MVKIRVGDPPYLSTQLFSIIHTRFVLRFTAGKGEVRRMKKEQMKLLSWGLMLLSLAAVFLAGVGSTGSDIWLASTQWLIAAAVLAEFGIYLRL